MVCAVGLAQAGKSVLVLEGGDKDWSEESQSIYRGDVVGDPYFDLDVCRLRQLGGTSNHWLGWCRPLDEIDFDPKRGLSPGWPIRKVELDAYLEAACRILELEGFEGDLHLPGGTIKEVQFQRSPPVRFADKYSDTLEQSKALAVALNANVVGLETNGQAVTGVEAIDGEGKPKHVRANIYVLAAGGIENSRLLLWSNERTNEQIVKDPGTLGRFWMEHPHHELGEAILTKEFAPRVNDQSFFAPTKEAIWDGGILNGRVWVVPSPYESTKRLIAELACVAPTASQRFFEMFNKNLVCGARVQLSFEQEPRSENRVELANERDRLGLPRTMLYWRKSDQDLQTARGVAALFGEWLARSDAGRLRTLPWLTGREDWPDDDELAGQHHMGGTRMASTATEGVVDENCKVFGQRNLYVAGSSVFPSGGYANPTLTIVQLALRLVDRILKVH